ncbi:hypothetical protein SAMN05444483_10980 [Salegentibacter echinorum]|uniref:Uncharacterized protein n=1 Tax=Salegentibacter echinorum TaxID=1073325 RepID=A0A1M5J2K5_SALEC|nr:hypothetical protein [Salegentibacter echinorum]SHG34529.1 hypothetical protein SAMN05444483_10980 [Salegentibacter echinorum]
MILSSTSWKEQTELMKERTFDYMVLETKIYEFTEDKDRLQPGVYIANLCNILRMVNESFDKAGIPGKIEFSIMGEVLTSIYTDTSLNNEQLERFFALNQKMEKTARAFQGISTMVDDLYFSSEIIQHMIGFDVNRQQQFRNIDENKYGRTDESFFELYFDFLEGKMTVQEFKKEGVEVMEKGLERAKEESLKA